MTILPVGNQKMLAEEPCHERHTYLTLDHKNWVDYLPFLGETKMEGILMTVLGQGSVLWLLSELITRLAKTVVVTMKRKVNLVI